MLVFAGYRMTGMWTEKYHEQTDQESVSSMALRDLPNVRAVLWTEKGEWQGMISIAVGEDGEFPLTGGRILRREKQIWTLQSFSLLLPRLESLIPQIKQWYSDRAGRKGDHAMMRLALSYIREGKPKKAISVLLATLRGEISEATVAESLSIAQVKWAKSREEKLRVALMWGGVFK